MLRPGGQSSFRSMLSEVCFLVLQEPMQWQLLRRVRDRVASILNRHPIDYEYLHFVCVQELQFVRAGTSYMDIPESVLGSLQQLSDIVSNYLSQRVIPPLFNDIAVTELRGSVGRPQITIESQTLLDMLSTELSLTSLSDLHGISRSTLYRRMKDNNLSVRKCYSDITDDVLDQKVRSIKARMPHAGYRLRVLFKHWGIAFHGDGLRGHCISSISMSINIFKSYFRLFRCFVTSHFHTILSLFLCPRVERLWRDLWSVTYQYYNVLHSLEEEGFIDLSNTVHLYCVGYVFIPRLRSDLHHFTESWNCHPLRTEGNLMSNQLWMIGMLQAPVAEADLVEVCTN
uniref:Integrase core domain-containing protein n=1 Tax=Acanthochromis polyacanthus TaxID=80966 RepID=A0A3Q1FF03_9TELE